VEFELLEQMRQAQPGSALLVQRVLEDGGVRQWNVLEGTYGPILSASSPFG
jgi:hypothetical protein